MKKMIIFWLMAITLISGVFAAAPSFDLGGCYDPSTSAVSDGFVPDLVILDNCTNYGQIDWSGSDLNLTDLGQLMDGEIEIGHGWAYVKSSFRPDLDDQATITLRNLSYAYQPVIDKDGSECADCSSVIWNAKAGTIQFTVTGFSNYSVTARHDFAVYSTENADLKDRIYNTVDLNSSYANQEFHCMVMLFDPVNKELVQTNPMTKKAGSFLGSATSSEQDLPDVLGYFKVVNGIGNVYFSKEGLVGYNTFIKVIKCRSNSTELIHEEDVTVFYSDPFASAPAKGVAAIQSFPNAVFVVIGGLILIVILFWILKELFSSRKN